MRLVRVAVPVPGLGLLTYRLPDGMQAPRGTRVIVQVGPRKVTGLVTHDNASVDDAPPGRLRDVLEVMPGLHSLRVDGGAAANDLLCQIQADQVGVPVERPHAVETTGLGAAFLAGLGAGVWSSTDELRDTWTLDRKFEPSADRAKADAAHARWRDAVERSKGWAD